MGKITVGNDELQCAYAKKKLVMKIYYGSILVYEIQPKGLIDAEGNNVVDSNNILIYVY